MFIEECSSLTPLGIRYQDGIDVEGIRGNSIKDKWGREQG